MKTIGLALAAALAAPPAAAQRSACTTATAPTTFPVTIPIEVWSNHIYVKVCANGQPRDFILDTGARATYIDMNHARAAGVKLGRSLTATGAGSGRIAGANIDGQSLTLAETSIAQPIAAALDFSALPPREGHRMDGILGYDFIARNVLAIDYAKRELRLYDRKSFTYSGPGTTLAISFFQMHPHVNAAVTLATARRFRGASSSTSARGTACSRRARSSSRALCAFSTWSRAFGRRTCSQYR